MADADDHERDEDDIPAEDALPDDASLIAFITEQPEPPKVKEIARAFNIRADKRAELRRHLRHLAETGQLKSIDGRRMAAPERLPPVAVLDIVEINHDGEGIAAPVEDRLDHNARILVVPDRRRGKAFGKGERVLAKLTLVGPDEYEARIIRKLDRHRPVMFGLVISARNGFMLEPVERNARSPLDLLPPEDKIPFADGDLIEAEVLRSSGYANKKARVTRNLGPADQPGAYSALAVAEYGIRHAFPEEALIEADKAKKPVLGEREDLRDLKLVTIDGADARDFDDAVCAEPLPGGGFRVVVAIADVAHYVAEDSALDREAIQRGNSVYLPDRVIPMLPEVLSNGLCSLVPGEERACLAVEMMIDANGHKTKHRFMRGLMLSHARLTYDAVEEFRLGHDTDPPAGLEASVINTMLDAYECLAASRRERGALELDLPEKRVRFDDDGKAVAIDRKRQTISQKLIEEFMILANVSAAETLEGNNRLCVFRAHEPPAPEKVDALHQLARSMELSFPKGQVIRPRHFNALLQTAQKKDDPAGFALLNETVLRSQSQADYRITNPGHFGLALLQYAHFTSPIRRYADLMVHRQIIALLENRDPDTDTVKAAETATSISETERQAAAAERRTIDRFAASLMQHRIGQMVEGKINTITSFGAFVEIDHSGVEGLLPLGRLPQDYYEADAVEGIIKGRQSGLTLRTGDSITIMIEDVSPLKAMVGLTYVDDGKPVERGASHGGRPGRRGASGRNRPSARKGAGKGAGKGVGSKGRASKKGKKQRR